MIPQHSTASLEATALPTIDGLHGVYISKCALFGLPSDPEISRRLKDFDQRRAREFDFSGIKVGPSFRPMLDALIAAPEIEALIWRRGALEDTHVESIVNAARRFIGLDEIDLGENAGITNIGGALLLQLVSSRYGTVPSVVRLDQTAVSFEMQARISAAVGRSRNPRVTSTSSMNNLMALNNNDSGNGNGNAGNGGGPVMSPSVRAFLRESTFAERDDDTALLGGEATGDRKAHSSASRVGGRATPQQLQQQQRGAAAGSADYFLFSEDSRRFADTVLHILSVAVHVMCRIVAVALWVKPMRTVVYAVCCGCAIALLLGPTSAFIDMSVLAVGFTYLMRSRKNVVAASSSSLVATSNSNNNVITSSDAVSAFAHFAGIPSERRRRWAFLLDPLEQLSRDIAMAVSSSVTASTAAAIDDTTADPTADAEQQQQRQQHTLLVRDIALRFIAFGSDAFASHLQLPLYCVGGVAAVVALLVRWLAGNSGAALGAAFGVAAAAFFAAEPLSRVAARHNVLHLRRRIGRWIAGVPMTSADLAANGGTTTALALLTGDIADEADDGVFARRRDPFAFVVEVLRIEDAVIRTSTAARNAQHQQPLHSHHHHNTQNVPPLLPVVKLRCMNKTCTTSEASVRCTRSGATAVTTSAHWHPQASVAFPSPHPYDTAKLVFSIYDGGADDAASVGAGTGTDILLSGTFLVDDDMVFGQEIAVPLKPVGGSASGSASAAALASAGGDASGGGATSDVWSLSELLLRQIDQRDAQERHRHHVYNQNHNSEHHSGHHSHHHHHQHSSSINSGGPLHSIDRAGVLVVRFTEVERSATIPQLNVVRPESAASLARRNHFHRARAELPGAAASVSNNNSNSNNLLRPPLSPPPGVTRLPVALTTALSNNAEQQSQPVSSRDPAAPSSSAPNPSTAAAAGANTQQQQQQKRGSQNNSKSQKPSATPRAMSEQSLCSTVSTIVLPEGERH